MDRIRLVRAWCCLAAMGLCGLGCLAMAQMPPAPTGASAPASQAAAQSQPASYPAATLEKGELKLTVYLPDAAEGYYRGPRFDPTSMMRAQYKGHTFFGPREGAKKHEPTVDDHGVGPSEEFGMEAPYAPQDFGDAKPGGAFMKIAVGLLQKPDKPDAKYFFRTAYKFVRPGAWTVTPSPGSITFAQDLKDDVGCAYTYTKTIRINEQADGFVIERTLKNTGDKPVETNHYAHNFISIDSTAVGADYELTLPFEPDAKAAKAPAAIEGKRVSFSAGYKNSWMNLIDAKAPAEMHVAAYNGATVRNVATGASVTLAGDQPVDKFNFWSEGAVLCPEPFVVVKVQPGREFKWQTAYTFAVEAK